MSNALGPAEKSIASVVETFRRQGLVVHPNEVARLVGCPHQAARQALSRLASFGVIPRRIVSVKTSIRPRPIEPDDWDKAPRTYKARRHRADRLRKQERINGLA
jgi:hypothetical protein